MDIELYIHVSPSDYRSSDVVSTVLPRQYGLDLDHRRRFSISSLRPPVSPRPVSLESIEFIHPPTMTVDYPSPGSATICRIPRVFVRGCCFLIDGVYSYHCYNSLG